MTVELISMDYCGQDSSGLRRWNMTIVIADSVACIPMLVPEDSSGLPDWKEGSLWPASACGRPWERFDDV